MRYRFAIAAALLLGAAVPLWAQPSAPSAPPGEAGRLEFVEFREVPLGAAMRLLSEQTGLNIAPSAEAAKLPVSLRLRDVEPLAAIRVLAQANDLWLRRDEASGAIVLLTSAERRRDLLALRETKTEVFALRGSGSREIALAIRDLFGGRVRLGFDPGAAPSSAGEAAPRESAGLDREDRPDAIGVSVSRGGELLAVRTSDREAIEQIAKVIERLDRPAGPPEPAAAPPSEPSPPPSPKAAPQ